jgi:hypothetical protein
MPSGAYAIAGLNGAGFYLAVGIDDLFKPFRLVTFCIRLYRGIHASHSPTFIYVRPLQGRCVIRTAACVPSGSVANTIGLS